MKHPKILYKTAFIGVFPFFYEDEQHQRVPAPINAMTDVDVRVYNHATNEEFSDFQWSRDGSNNFLIDFHNGIKARGYDVVISGKLGGRIITATWADPAFEGVVAIEQTTWDNFVAGNNVDMQPCVMVLSADTAAIAEIQAELEQAIAEADAAKAEYIRKAQELEGVAQQGDNPNATNTAILAAVGGIEPQPIPTDYAKEATLQRVYAEHITSLKISGAVFDSLTIKPSVLDVLWRGSQLLSLEDDEIELINEGAQNSGLLILNKLTLLKLNKLKEFNVPEVTNTFISSSSLTRVELPNLERYLGSGRLFMGDAVKYVSMPKCLEITNTQFMRSCMYYEVLDVSSCATDISLSNYQTNADYLIDLIIGKNISKSWKITNWRASEALLTNSTSLVYDGETFASNREKLLYNLREHIAANLPTLTNEGYSLNFGAPIKAAILADAETTEAFTNKGWTIA